jgi:hypothetical protein
MSLSISSNGAVTGSASSASGVYSSVSGTVSSTGVANLTLTPNSGAASTVTGTLNVNNSGELTGSFKGSNGSTTTVTACTSAAALQYTGTYSGTFTASGGVSGQIDAFVTSAGAIYDTSISSTGVVSGLSGLIGQSGVITDPNTYSPTVEGYAAFNASGQLVLMLKSNLYPSFTATLNRTSTTTNTGGPMTNYNGSIYSTAISGNVGSLRSFTLDPFGNVNGQATTPDGTQIQILGAVLSSGVASISLMSDTATTQGPYTIGKLSTNSSGQLTATFTGSAGTTVITAATSSAPFEYAGTYTGTFAISGGTTGSASVTISSAGALSGTTTSSAAPAVTSTLSGTVTNAGAVTVSIGGNPQSVAGNAAFNASGQLVIVVKPSRSSATTETLTLSKSS